MFKLGIDVLNRDFCIQIGYNRKAVKTYGKGQNGPLEGATQQHPLETNVAFAGLRPELRERGNEVS